MCSSRANIGAERYPVRCIIAINPPWVYGSCKCIHGRRRGYGGGVRVIGVGIRAHFFVSYHAIYETLIGRRSGIQNKKRVAERRRTEGFGRMRNDHASSFTLHPLICKRDTYMHTRMHVYTPLHMRVYVHMGQCTAHKSNFCISVVDSCPPPTPRTPSLRTFIGQRRVLRTGNIRWPVRVFSTPFPPLKCILRSRRICFVIFKHGSERMPLRGQYLAWSNGIRQNGPISLSRWGFAVRRGSLKPFLVSTIMDHVEICVTVWREDCDRSLVWSTRY